MAASVQLINWAIFIALSLIWGSSFILMKIGLQSLTAYQVAAIRLLSAGIVLLPVAARQFRKMPMDKMHLIIISGIAGSFLPAFLFCIAETKIDSSLTGILNALTPVFTLTTGILFFKTPLHWRKLAGVVTGLAGLCLLLLSKGKIELAFLPYATLVILATVCYGFNVNMVSKYLRDTGSLNIAAFAFSFLTVPSFLILYFSGYFTLSLTQKPYLISTGAAIILGVMGTAVASVIFYMLVKRAGVLFTSMVTYAIPFVAILWGLLYQEGISLLELVCLGIILAGVSLTNN
ncbi:MAG: DMT family transporter [Chitinophagaceae bacterium]